MSKNDDERLVDILIGEAVMALLQQESPVFAKHVVAKLQTMATSERNSLRQQACQRAIAELISSTGQSDQENALQSDDDRQESDITFH